MFPSNKKIDINLKYIYENFYKHGDPIAESQFINEDKDPDFQFHDITSKYMLTKGLLDIKHDKDGAAMYFLSEFAVEIIEKYGGWEKYVKKKNSFLWLFRKESNKQILFGALIGFLLSFLGSITIYAVQEYRTTKALEDQLQAQLQKAAYTTYQIQMKCIDHKIRADYYELKHHYLDEKFGRSNQKSRVTPVKEILDLHNTSIRNRQLDLIQLDAEIRSIQIQLGSINQVPIKLMSEVAAIANSNEHEKIKIEFPLFRNRTFPIMVMRESEMLDSLVNKYQEELTFKYIRIRNLIEKF